MASDHQVGADTAETCWLCDHERNELCHVHAPRVVEPTVAWAARELVQAPPVWDVVKASALKRLGKPLLIWYGVLLVIGVVTVTVSLLVMRFG